MPKNNLEYTAYHNANVKTSILVNSPPQKIWKKISNVIDLDWLAGIKSCTSKSHNKSGIGTHRQLKFDDGSVIDEYIVGWENEHYFSYIAVSGLPLRGYHATISLTPASKRSKITWESYFNTEEMTQLQFNEFCSFLESFYKNSLENLKKSLE
jgi:hypothetical protein